MNVQSDWWLLLVGLIIGAGLTWLVLAEMRRRDDDVSREERATEADWIVATLGARGMEADADAVQEVLRLHRTYLAGIPAATSIWDAGDPSWPTPEDLAADAREGAPEAGAPASANAAMTTEPLTAVARPAATTADPAAGTIGPPAADGDPGPGTDASRPADDSTT
jgi:hypothetical protein